MVDNPEGSLREPGHSANAEDLQRQDEDDDRESGDGDRQNSKPPKTTTISTIAVQSGNTRLVIALLQVRLNEDEEEKRIF